MKCIVVFHVHKFFCIYNIIGIPAYVTYFIYASYLQYNPHPLCT